MTDFETEYVKDSDPLKMDDSNRLLYEMVVRLSALEITLVKTGVIVEKDLAEAQIECMQKIKDALDKYLQTSESKQDNSSGFIKYGDIKQNA